MRGDAGRLAQLGAPYGGEGADANPVAGRALATRRITVHGPEPESLGIHTDDGELGAWTVDNLRSYWAPWAAALRAGGAPS
ncbi:MAG: hypothetical protein HYU28_03980 [Actinobacteria bacterium]|nr:hypothetical protein [Actinomycetota bacterium]